MQRPIRTSDDLRSALGTFNGCLGAALFWGFLILMIALTGCSSTPFLELGAGYDFNRGNYAFFEPHPTVTGALQRTPFDLDCGIGYAAVGGDWENGMTWRYIHQSCIDPSRPAEKVTDAIIITKKWGGIQ